MPELLRPTSHPERVPYAAAEAPTQPAFGCGVSATLAETSYIRVEFDRDHSAEGRRPRRRLTGLNRPVRISISCSIGLQ